jgi:hypothetical protein
VRSFSNFSWSDFSGDRSIGLPLLWDLLFHT